MIASRKCIQISAIYLSGSTLSLPPPFRDTKVEKRFYVTRDGYKVIRVSRDLRFINKAIDVISSVKFFICVTISFHLHFFLSIMYIVWIQLGSSGSVQELSVCNRSKKKRIRNPRYQDKRVFESLLMEVSDLKREEKVLGLSLFYCNNTIYFF